MENIILHEVGLRDGLQMEKEVEPFDVKIEWVKKIVETGTDIIQLGSFVHKEKMPQMADTDELFNYFKNENHPKNVIFSGLILNEKGLERALACNVDLICMGVSASETHSKKNTGMTVTDAANRIAKIAGETISIGKKVQASVQSAFGCGFEGRIDENVVYSIVEKYLNAGVKIISLADTAGHANPKQVERMFGKIFKMSPEIELACHFHNTYGMGIVNCYAALNTGVKYFETAFGGLGGCPFTKMAAGNVCTEDFVHFLHEIGLREDIDLTKLNEIAKEVSVHFKRELPGMVYKTGGIKH